MDRGNIRAASSGRSYRLAARFTSLLAPLLVIALLALAGCGSGVRGSGTVKTETRSVSGFTNVSLTGIGTLNIRQTGTESLSITAEDNLLPLLTSDVSNGTLTLGIKQGQSIAPTKNIVYTLTVKTLNGLSISGASNVNIQGLSTNALSVTISGLAQVSVSGRAQSQTVRLSGAGAYQGRNLQTATTQLSVSGAGNATISASQTLDVTISGAGNVTYYGSPQVTQSISGAGKVIKGS